MVPMALIWWIYHFWARFWPYFNFADFRAYFGQFSVTIPSLVRGIYNTKGFIYSIHNVSLGNWWRFDHISNLHLHGKRRKQEKNTFLPCWENSVTEVMFLPGIGGHLKVSHMDPRVSFGNESTNLSVQKSFLPFYIKSSHPKSYTEFFLLFKELSPLNKKNLSIFEANAGPSLYWQ